MTTRLYEYKDKAGDALKVESLDEHGVHVFIVNPAGRFSKMVMLPPDELRRLARALDPDTYLEREVWGASLRERIEEVKELRLEIARLRAAAAEVGPDEGPQPQCGDECDGMVCYRMRGHDGEHEGLAPDGSGIMEQWGEAPAEPVERPTYYVGDGVHFDPVEPEAAPKGGAPGENDAQEMVLAHVSDGDLLRRAREEARDTGEGCHPAVAAELGRRGLVAWVSDDENEEDTGTLTAKGRAALTTATEPPAAPLPEPPTHDGEPTDDEQREHALDLLAWAVETASRGRSEADQQRLRWALDWVSDDAPVEAAPLGAGPLGARAFVAAVAGVLARDVPDGDKAVMLRWLIEDAAPSAPQGGPDPRREGIEMVRAFSLAHGVPMVSVEMIEHWHAQHGAAWTVKPAASPPHGERPEPAYVPKVGEPVIVTTRAYFDHESQMGTGLVLVRDRPGGVGWWVQPSAVRPTSDDPGEVET